jgi:hypothetical protein
MKHSRERAASVWWFATATKKGVFVHTGRCYICRLGKGWECSGRGLSPNLLPLRVSKSVHTHTPCPPI